MEAGTVLGAFEITGLLGLGGMGEVYRARDIKLRREVAIKVLPASLAADAERLVRFQREAMALAALNHPHVGAIYGLDEADGIHFLVLELVEGETLSDRIARAPLSVEEAVPLFIQIAEALEAAHEAGIVHRDLKPGNIKVTDDDRAKVLDFGIAKFGGRGSDSMSGQAQTPVHWDSQAPTVPSTPTPSTGITQAGMLVGTPFYMSPEQTRGKKVDRRSDIWAFGCCLYECLTGERLFRGSTIEETVHAIQKVEPNLERLPTNAHQRLRELIRRCLEKDSKMRLRDIGEAWVELNKMREDSGPGADVRKVSRRMAAGLVVATVVLIGFGLAIGASQLLPSALPADDELRSREHMSSAGERPVRRFNVNLDPKFPLYSAVSYDTPLAFSPDGSMIVYTTQDANQNTGLAGFPLDGLSAHVVVEDWSTHRPFFSPDGKWIGFDIGTWSVGVVPVDGRTQVREVAEIQLSLGPSWGDDGYIYYSGKLGAGIFRVNAQGGDPQVVTELQAEPREVVHAFPRILPGSRGLMYASLSSLNIQGSRLMLLDQHTGETTVIAEKAGGAYYVSSGHLVYSQEVRLMAVPFDLESLAVTGPAVDVTELGMTDGLSAITKFAVSERGSLAYVPATAESLPDKRFLLWVQMDGTAQRVTDQSYAAYDMRISPDGIRIGMSMKAEGIEGIHTWTYDVNRGTIARHTSDGLYNYFAGWTPDGKSIYTCSLLGGEFALYRRRLDSSGGDEGLMGDTTFTERTLRRVDSVTPDGNYALILSVEDRADLLLADLKKNDPPIPLLYGTYNEFNGSVSPDGRLVAYQSDETGRMEVYLQTFPTLGSKVMVSNDGGFAPIWHPDGSKLYFLSGTDQMRVADVNLVDGLVVGVPRLQFSFEHGHSPYWTRQYDIHPDGSKFLMVERDPEFRGIGQIVIVEHWGEVLKKKLSHSVEESMGGRGA